MVGADTGEYISRWGEEVRRRLSYESGAWSKVSMPSRKESREREMWLSWDEGSRSREMARCRSRSESLMWSERRKS